DLLEHDLAGRPVLVVLVRRVARPVARRREHLDDEDPLGGEAGLDHVVDLPRRVAGAAYLDRDLVRPLEHRLEPALGRAARDGELGLALDPVLGVAREVERPRQLLEDAGARAELEALPAGLHRAAAREQDERDLLPASAARVRPGEALDAEGEEAPARRRGRDPVPLARPEQQAHGSTSTLTARPARSSSIAAGSSSSPIRCVTSGSRSSRPCSSSRIASGKTSWPTKLPRIVSSPRVIRSCATSARACVFTPKRSTRPPLATRSSAAGSWEPTASTTTSAGSPGPSPGATTRAAPSRSASAARSGAGSTATTVAPASESSATNMSP